MPAAGPQKQYFDALAADTFRIQRCSDCTRHVFPPRVQCPHCAGTRLSWIEPAGTGTVYSATVFRRRPADGGDQQIALIDLDEGVRLMSRVEQADPAAVRIGQRVRARVLRQDDAPLLVFEPLED